MTLPSDHIFLILVPVTVQNVNICRQLICGKYWVITFKMLYKNIGTISLWKPKHTCHAHNTHKRYIQKLGRYRSLTVVLLNVLSTPMNPLAILVPTIGVDTEDVEEQRLGLLVPDGIYHPLFSLKFLQ